MRALTKIAVAIALALVGTAAYAQAQSDLDALERVKAADRAAGGNYAYVARAGVHAHDGFFLRLDLGGGYMESNATVTVGGVPVDGKLSGPAGSFGVAIGGEVSQNLILAGHLYSKAISDPKASANGGSVTLNDTSWSMVGIGPQLTYYFMPANVYLSGTIAATRLVVSANGTDANSDWGVGARLALGKEWWVSDDWGLGLAGLVSWSSNKDQGAETISSWGLGLAFSATYN